MADSPLLGSFDADGFRSNIVATMVMGLPVEDELKPTFYFRATLSYPSDTKLDGSGKPIDARVRPTVTSPDPVQIPVAIEYVTDTTNDEGMVGTYWSDRAIVTVLDAQYALVEDAIEVDLSGRRYLIQNSTALALGPVGVWQLYCFKKGVNE